MYLTVVLLGFMAILPAPITGRYYRHRRTKYPTTKRPTNNPSTAAPTSPTTTLSPVSASPTTTHAPVSVVKVPASTTWFNGAWGVDSSQLTAANVAGRRLIIVDLDDATVAQISAYKQQGHIVQCYISVGTYETWRADTQANAATWRAASVGVVSGWPQEMWLDLSKQDVLHTLMLPRFQKAMNKGCQALELDNVDCYDNTDCWGKMGGMTSAQVKTLQIQYNTWQVQTGHGMGMAVSLKNAIDLLSVMGDMYDFAVNESCFTYDECDAYLSTMVAHDKAVFVHEYGLSPNICTKARSMNLRAAQCASTDGNICSNNANWQFCDPPSTW